MIKIKEINERIGKTIDEKGENSMEIEIIDVKGNTKLKERLRRKILK